MNPQTSPSEPTVNRPAFARWLGDTNDITSVCLNAGRIPGLVNLAGGLPDPSTFPVTELAHFAEQAILSHPQDTLAYGPVEGLPELRDCIAARLSTPGMALARENVFITTSGMQGLELIGKVLLDDGALIAAQYPTYLGALDAWRPRYPQYRNVMLEHGALDATAALAGAQFAYTVPNFSNPTGRLVTEATRRALVNAAYATGTWLVEDDPYGTLHYDGTPVPSMLELSAERCAEPVYNGPVVYMGTLSKQIVPGLRVGWVVAAPDMIKALTAAKQGSDICTSGLTQCIALQAFESGLIDQLQSTAVDLYRVRRDALCAALTQYAAEWVTWESPVGGMFVWVTLKSPEIDTDRLMTACLDAGVCVSPSSVFDAFGKDHRSLRLNFTLNTPERLVLGVQRLVAALIALSR